MLYMLPVQFTSIWAVKLRLPHVRIGLIALIVMYCDCSDISLYINSTYSYNIVLVIVVNYINFYVCLNKQIIKFKYCKQISKCLKTTIYMYFISPNNGLGW